jgi:uncharacterized protein (DUF2252 family)
MEPGAARAGRGKEARRLAPRGAHGEWAPAGDRPDPVDVLEGQSTTRIPQLVPIRYGRMLASPFAFYRGGAALMAADLAGTPTSGIDVQLCGDAHVANFGVFLAPDRRPLFDLNDFDETHVGPWEWDLKRLAVSIAVLGRHRGLGERRRRSAVLATVAAYRNAMRDFAAWGNLQVWYARLDVENLMQQARLRDADFDLAGAERSLDRFRRKDSTRAAAKLAERVDGRLRIVHDPPLVVPIRELLTTESGEELQARFAEMLDGYCASLPPQQRHLIRTHRFVDMAHKVVGVGSAGTRCWVVLLEGRDTGDPLVLQAKEADASVLERHLRPSAYDHHGERVVQGQRFMQAASDILLGWHRALGLDGVTRDFYLRQLWDGKGSIDTETIPVDRIGLLGGFCAWTLARAHARSGDRVAIAAYLGSADTFDRAIADFAEAYADQNERDHAALERAAQDGRVAADTSV